MSLLGVIIGVLGLVLSLLLFWIQRIKKYPSQLCYSILECSKIVGKKESEFKNVSLRYKDYSVEEDLFYVKILIFNQRTSDVKAERPESFISLILSDKSKWLDIRVKHESDSVGSTVAINEGTKQNANLSFPLLKKGESVLLEGLIESDSSLTVNDNSILHINHRVAGLDAFKHIPVVTERMYKRSKRSFKFFGITMGIMLCFMVSTLFLPYRSPLLYYNNSDPKDNTEYRVLIDKKEGIVVEEFHALSFGFESVKVIPKEEFETDYRPTYVFHESFTFYFNLVTALMFVLFLVYSLFEPLKDYYRYRVLSKFKE